MSLPEKWLRQREPSEQDGKVRATWLADCDSWRDRAEIGVLKARDGEDGLWRKVIFDKERVRFTD